MTIKQYALISEFVTIDHGKYIVKVSIVEDGIILATGLAGKETVEKAEDEARQRAIEVLNWYHPKVDRKEDNRIITTSSHLNNTSPSPKTKQNIKINPPIPSAISPVIEEKVMEITDYTPKKEITEIQEEKSDNSLWEEYNDSDLTDTPPPKPTVSHENNQETFISEEETPLFLDNEDNQETFISEEETPLFQPSVSEDEYTNENLLLFSESNEDISELTLPLDYSENENIDNSEIVDFGEIVDKTSLEMKRLGWTQEQGKKYLLETYGKKSRHLLSDNELIEFLKYLQSQ